MRLGFAIMAHEAAAELAELVDTLVACDCLVSIHYDANASDEQFILLKNRYAHCAAVFFAAREKCGWGEFSLVRGTLNCLEAFERGHVDLDYVYLISGADIPVKTIASLKSFLAHSYKEETEFIEYYPLDETSWVKGGLEAERFLYRFFINERRHPIWFTLSWKVQRFLGLQVQPPVGVRLALGSQWWCLTWKTCKGVLDYIKKHPAVYKFFKRTWIPDESFFQTIVGALVPRGRIRSHSLTFYQFSDYCKPYVFFDEHRSFLRRLKFFFARKIALSAKGLRSELLTRARQTAATNTNPRVIGQGTIELDAMRAPRRVPDRATRAVGRFYHAYLSDLLFTGRIIVVILTPYSFVPLAYLRNTPSQQGDVMLHGHLFDCNGIEFAGNHSVYGGYSRTDVHIRDAHPAAFLANVAGAGPKITAFFATIHEFRVHLANLVELTNVVFAIMPTGKVEAILTGNLLRDQHAGDSEWQPDLLELQAHADALSQGIAGLLALPHSKPEYSGMRLLSQQDEPLRTTAPQTPKIDDDLRRALGLVNIFVERLLGELESSRDCSKITAQLRQTAPLGSGASYLDSGVVTFDES